MTGPNNYTMVLPLLIPVNNVQIDTSKGSAKLGEFFSAYSSQISVYNSLKSYPISFMCKLQYTHSTGRNPFSDVSMWMTCLTKKLRGKSKKLQMFYLYLKSN